MPAHSVVTWVHQLEMRRPRRRMSGTLASNTGSPRIIAPGAASDACMKVAMHSGGCWPSASMVSAWVKPACCAAISPSRIAAPLPPLRARTSTRSDGSSRASAVSASALPSVLPSTTTHTGSQLARAARTVSNARAPGL